MYFVGGLYLWFGTTVVLSTGVQQAVDEGQAGLLLKPLQVDAYTSGVPEDCKPHLRSMRLCQQHYGETIKSQSYAIYDTTELDELCRAHNISERCLLNASTSLKTSGCEQYALWELSVSEMITALCVVNESVYNVYKGCAGTGQIGMICQTILTQYLASSSTELSQEDENIKFCREINSHMGCKWSVFGSEMCGEALKFQKMLDRISMQPFDVSKNCTLNMDYPLCSPMLMVQCSAGLTGNDLNLPLESFDTPTEADAYCRKMSASKSCMDQLSLTGCYPLLDFSLGAIESFCEDEVLTYLSNQTCLRQVNSSDYIFRLCTAGTDTCETFGETMLCLFDVTQASCGCDVVRHVTDIIESFYLPATEYAQFCDKQEFFASREDPCSPALNSSDTDNHQPNKTNSAEYQSSDDGYIIGLALLVGKYLI